MKYTFFKDELGTIWYRDCFQVEAETYEEACEKAQSIISNEEDLEIEWCEPIYETWNEISLEDNDGFTTLELQDEDGKIIYRNGK